MSDYNLYQDSSRLEKWKVFDSLPRELKEILWEDGKEVIDFWRSPESYVRIYEQRKKIADELRERVRMARASADNRVVEGS